MSKSSTFRALSGSALAACLIASSGALHLAAADASAQVRTFRTTKKQPAKPASESKPQSPAPREGRESQRPPRDADDDYGPTSLRAWGQRGGDDSSKEGAEPQDPGPIPGDEGPVEPDPRPEPEPDTPSSDTQIVTSLNGNGLYVNIEENGIHQKVLIKPNGADLWAPFPNSDYDSVEPDIQMTASDDGFDLRYTFVNDTNRVANLGTLQVPGLRLGRTLGTRMIDFDGREQEIDMGNSSFYFGPRRKWPDDGFGLYSPVTILRDNNLRLGMSVQYDVRDYKHVVAIRHTVPGGGLQSSGLNWMINFELNPEDDDFSEDGLLQPGESRVYTVSLRAQTNAEQQRWTHVLEPYREFFEDTYGGAQYAINREPLVSIPIAITARISPTNPRGFTPTRARLDDIGWSHTVERMQEFVDTGYSRFIVRAPTGLYANNRSNNFPFQFASAWDDIPRALETEHLLRNFANQPGIELGLWWGRAAQVMTSWDTPHYETLDTDEPALMQAARDEIDAATRAGAVIIGMDAVLLAEHWDLYEWFTEMRSVDADMTLAMEPFGPDFLHTLAANYVWAIRPTDQGREGELEVTRELELANYLIPGQETWAQIRSGDIAQRYGYDDMEDVPRQMIIDEVVRVANLGFVPFVHDVIDYDPSFVAVDPNANDD